MHQSLTVSQLNEALTRQSVFLLDRIDEKFAAQKAEILEIVDQKIDALREDICNQLVDLME